MPRAAPQALHADLEERNQSAAASLAERLEETQTLHELGVYAVLGVSFKTTNCLESVNALVVERCAKADACSCGLKILDKIRYHDITQ